MKIATDIFVDESEIEFEFFRSRGPGGQNVNKVATAVRLRFDVTRTRSLGEDLRERLKRLGRARITARGVLVIEARRFRTQERNRREALEKLAELICRAAETPRARRPTQPTRAARERRLKEKRSRSERKRLRRPPLWG